MEWCDGGIRIQIYFLHDRVEKSVEFNQALEN